MTIVLVGVAADTQNSDPIGPLYEGGQFEYIPIPETVEETTEDRTYGSVTFRSKDRPLAQYLNWIKPGGDDARKKSGYEEISEHPLHFDPDFTHLTYGESASRPEYVERLSKLTPNEDALAFYAGLTDTNRKHRYMIGYFVVNEVIHLTGSPDEDRSKIFSQYPHNAHSKRYFGKGESKHEELVIVDGKQPGRLLDKATIRMSSYDRFGAKQYYLSDEFARKFPIDDPSYSHNPESDKKEDKIWLGFKPALEVDLTADEFIDRVENTEII